MKNLKILHTVEFYSPSVGGAQEVVKQISEHLVKLGHDITVATTKLPSRNFRTLNGVKIKEFKISGNKVRGFTGEKEKYKSWLKKSNFDLVMNYAAQQWATDLFFEVIDQISAKKILVPCGFSGLYNPNYKEYFKKLPSILKKYDASIYLSNNYRDINFARKNKIKNLIIIPNGADEQEFAKINNENAKKFRNKYGINDNELLFLNVSTHTGVKGHKETIQAFKKAKVKNATLVFVGDINPHSGCYKSCKKSEFIQNKIMPLFNNNNKKIKVISISREETIDAYNAADIFLFLSNIECSPLVLFEAAAAGKPFISSNCGNAKEIAKWTKSGIITKSTQDIKGYTKIDINDSVEKIEKLANNKKLRIKLGLSGRKAWQNKFTWEKITKEYEKIYLKL